MSYVNLVDWVGRRHRGVHNGPNDKPRKQRTPVADIQTVLRVIMQLSCRNLGALKREICEVYVRPELYEFGDD